MSGAIPADVDMVVESEFEMDTDALYNDDEDTIIDAEPIVPPTSTGPAEVEMVGVDDGADVSLDVDEETTGPEGEPALPETEDVAIEDADGDNTPEVELKEEGEQVEGEDVALDETAPVEAEGEAKGEDKVTLAAPPPCNSELPPSEHDTAAQDEAASTSEAVAPSVDAEADSFVLVEAPSDSEANGNEPELPHEGQVDDTQSEQHTDAEAHDLEDERAEDDQDDSFSSFSDTSSANFPSDFFLPTILTYPASSTVPTPSSYSLFRTFDAEEAHPVLLGANADLFCAPLSEVFDALREEAAFSVEDKALNMEDEAGTLEWVLEHENEGVALVIGEDNRHASDFSLQDLAKLHSHCGLGAPMRLRLRTGGTRFLLRVHKIQEIRREMDEEVGSDHDEDAEHWHQEDETHFVEHDEEEHVNSPGHPEEAETNVADPHGRTVDHVDNIESNEPYQTEPEDYPTGPDDPTVVQASTIEDPASELAADEAKETVAAVDANTEPASIEEATLVVTGNEDVEIPSEAIPSVNDRGDLDADATGGLYDDEPDEAANLSEKRAAHVDESSATELVAEESEDLSAEIEREAAAATTSSGAVESVPVPPQFVIHADSGEDAVHVDNAPSVSGSGSASASTLVAETSAAEPTPASTRRSTRLNPSDAAGPSTSTPADRAVSSSATTLSAPDDTAPYAADGSDDVDLYADSPLPSKPVDTLDGDAIEPLGLHDEHEDERASGGEETGSTADDPNPEIAVEETNGGGSDHTLAESVDEADAETDDKDGGGASPKRRFDELAEDEAVEVVEERDPKRHKAD